ncbi:MAG TPA: hypothetical protein VNX28_13295, partial [Gemmataceae bacterium]|nr:hypothetical protein [Gemmataceae bacterium]
MSPNRADVGPEEVDANLDHVSLVLAQYHLPGECLADGPSAANVTEQLPGLETLKQLLDRLEQDRLRSQPAAAESALQAV